MANILERLANSFDLPAETAGAPKVTLTGAERVLVENHRGILSYSENAVEIGARKARLTVRGDGLLLRAMDSEMLLITGHIFGVEIE